jgi:hypothetical protein
MNHQDRSNQKPGINPLVAAATGIVVGAGAVLAGAIAVSKNGNQEKIEKVAKDVEKELIKAKNNAKKTAKAGLDYLDRQVDEAKGGVKKI